MGERSLREMTALRAPALPAQSNPGGRFRKGGEAPLRVKDAVAFIVLIVVLLVQVAGWLPWRVTEEA